MNIVTLDFDKVINWCNAAKCNLTCATPCTIEICAMVKECAAGQGESAPTDAQPLKAEIAALIPDISSLSNVYTRAHGIDRIIERLRQLSAV